VLRRLLAQGEANGCRGLHLLDQAQLGAFLPQVGGIGAMVSPETGIFDPFLYTVALAENAVANGVHFFFRHPVTAIAPGSQGGYVVTRGETFWPGWWSTPPGCSVTGSPPWRGGGIASILPGNISSWTRLQGTCCPCRLPRPQGGGGKLGVHLTPTIHGNLPSAPAPDISQPGDTASTQQAIDGPAHSSRQLFPLRPGRRIAEACAGLRPKLAPP
ncbi:MAG: FAD-dependent oxidoreductase, partial [Flavonifractor plautii]